MSAPFAIDPATGRLRFPDLDLDLTPGMPQAAFISATARLNRDNLGANDGWQRYSVREIIAGDRKLGLFIMFFNRRLTKLSFAWSQKDETWDDWSEASEAARRKEYQQAIDSQLGGKSEFAWGTVAAIQDNKSGGADIWVEYSQSYLRVS
jgi:hypothetical protein